jgi:hypothetical protein
LLWKQGGNLNKYKCSFTKLQTELGVSYEPKRDDSEIKRLNQFLESVANHQENQQVISTISAEKTQAIAETKPQLTLAQSAEIYPHYSAALPNLLAQEEKLQLSQKFVEAIADFIDQSSIESVLAEALPPVIKELSQYQQDLAKGTATFNQPRAALTQAEKRQLSQKPTKTPTRTTDKPKLKENRSAELYKYYSADLQNLLVTDRDKEIGRCIMAV